jgi:hypothetical protein
VSQPADIDGIDVTDLIANEEVGLEDEKLKIMEKVISIRKGE